MDGNPRRRHRKSIAYKDRKLGNWMILLLNGAFTGVLALDTDLGAGLHGARLVGIFGTENGCFKLRAGAWTDTIPKGSKQHDNGHQEYGPGHY